MVVQVAEVEDIMVGLVVYETGVGSLLQVILRALEEVDISTRHWQMHDL